MADDGGALPLSNLRSILAGRLKPDAQDLLAIRARIADLEARQADLSATKLRAFTNRAEIARNTDELGLLGTCEIVAREHVRANPHQSRNLELLQKQARDAPLDAQQRQEQAREGVGNTTPAPARGFDRAAWRQKRINARLRARGGRDEDD